MVKFYFHNGQMEPKDSGKSGTQDTRERRKLDMEGEKNIKVSQNQTQSYGSRAKSSFEEILKCTEDSFSKRNVRTNREDNRSINPSEMQSRKPKNTSINCDSDVICPSKIRYVVSIYVIKLLQNLGFHETIFIFFSVCCSPISFKKNI